MRQILSISILFPGCYFHGKSDYGKNEWPPSPFRLYQALFAAARCNGMNLEGCFKWLEGLEPPVIISPAYKSQDRDRIVYVPNNDSDHKPKNRHSRIEKNFRSILIKDKEKPVVSYFWPIATEDRKQAEQIIMLANHLTHVGWGIDMVTGTGKILSLEEKQALLEHHTGDIWTVSRHHGNLSRVPGKGPCLPGQTKDRNHHLSRIPGKGSLENLIKVRKSQLSKIRNDVYQTPLKPTRYRTVQYSSNQILYRPTVCFQIVDAEGKQYKSFPARNTIEVSAWVRSKCCEKAQKNFVDGIKSKEFVAGHQQGRARDLLPRFSYLPIPSIGHKHVDGYIRRLIIAEPYGGNGIASGWVCKVLNGQTITDSRGTEQGVLRLIPEPWEDRIFKRYIERGKTFYSITPVILPGHDSLNYTKAGKLFEKTITQAGLNLKYLCSFELQKAPYFPGAHHPENYKKARHFKRFSAIHARVTFKKEIYGPLSLGAGRFRGLGLFVAIPD